MYDRHGLASKLQNMDLKQYRWAAMGDSQQRIYSLHNKSTWTSAVYSRK